MNIKVLRIDNGSEFTSTNFTNFCKEEGIKRENTMAYNRQQNGVVERNNRSIISVVKAMMHEHMFLMILWA
jgi:transposase InsO family protein